MLSITVQESWILLLAAKGDTLDVHSCTCVKDWILSAPPCEECKLKNKLEEMEEKEWQ